MFGWNFFSDCTVLGMSHRYDTILAHHFRKRKGFDEKSVISVTVQVYEAAYIKGLRGLKKIFLNKGDIMKMTAKGKNNTFIDKLI